MCDGHTDKQEAHNKIPVACVPRGFAAVSFLQSPLVFPALIATAGGEGRREIEWQKCQQEKPSCHVVHKLVRKSSA